MLRLKNLFAKKKDAEHNSNKKNGTRKLFGVALEQSTPSVPLLVVKIVEQLRGRALLEQGIFRVSGDYLEIQELRKQFDDGLDVDITKVNVHTLCGLLKLYLRELPEPLITYDAYDALIATQVIDDMEIRHQCIRQLILALPPASFCVLSYVCQFLNEVHNDNAINKMTAGNLAIVFAPNFMHARQETIEITIHDSPHTKAIATALIRDCSYFFSTDALQEPGNLSTERANSLTAPVVTSPVIDNKKRKISFRSRVKSVLLDGEGTPPTQINFGGGSLINARMGQVLEMGTLVEDSVTTQLGPLLERIVTELEQTTRLDHAMRISDAINNVRKVLNEGPDCRLESRPSSGIIHFQVRDDETQRSKVVQSTLSQIEKIRKELLYLVAEARSVPEICKHLEEEVGLGQMIYIMRQIKMIRQTLQYKTKSMRNLRVRSLSHESLLAEKFDEGKESIADMTNIVESVRRGLSYQTPTQLIFLARVASSIHVVMSAPLGRTQLPDPIIPPATWQDEPGFNYDMQKSLIEVVQAVLQELDYGIVQFKEIMSHIDWVLLRQDWHVRANEIMPLLKKLKDISDGYGTARDKNLRKLDPTNRETAYSALDLSEIRPKKEGSKTLKSESSKHFYHNRLSMKIPDNSVYRLSTIRRSQHISNLQLLLNAARMSINNSPLANINNNQNNNNNNHSTNNNNNKNSTQQNADVNNKPNQESSTNGLLMEVTATPASLSTIFSSISASSAEEFMPSGRMVRSTSSATREPESPNLQSTRSLGALPDGDHRIILLQKTVLQTIDKLVTMVNRMYDDVINNSDDSDKIYLLNKKLRDVQEALYTELKKNDVDNNMPSSNDNTHIDIVDMDSKRLRDVIISYLEEIGKSEPLLMSRYAKTLKAVINIIHHNENSNSNSSSSSFPNSPVNTPPSSLSTSSPLS